jgi:Chromate transporter
MLAVSDEGTSPDTWLPKAGSLPAISSLVSPSSKPFPDRILTVNHPPRSFGSTFGLEVLTIPPTVAVYLGTLAVQGTSVPLAVGAVIGYVAIFTPGLVLHTGTMGLWRTLRGYRWFTSCLRGVNASAVGLVYTAVFRLWQIGYLDAENQQGTSLESDPWWVVITATSFVGGMWFKLQAPAAILLGGAMGMVWYGIVRA